MRFAASGIARSSPAPARAPVGWLWAALLLLATIVRVGPFVATNESHFGGAVGLLPLHGVVAARATASRGVPRGAELGLFGVDINETADLAPRSPKPVRAIRARWLGCDRSDGRHAAGDDVVVMAPALPLRAITLPLAAADSALIAVSLARALEDSGVRAANRARGPPARLVSIV